MKLTVAESNEIDRLLSEIEVADPHTSAELADRLLEYVEAIERRNLAGTSAGAEIASTPEIAMAASSGR
jgi:hypothetical protein